MRTLNYKRGAIISITEVADYVQRFMQTNLNRLLSAGFSPHSVIGSIFDKDANIYQGQKYFKFIINPDVGASPHEIELRIDPGSAMNPNGELIKLSQQMAIDSSPSGETEFKTFLENAHTAGNYWINVYINRVLVELGDARGGWEPTFRNGLPVSGDRKVVVDQAGAETEHFDELEDHNLFSYFFYTGRSDAESDTSLIIFDAQDNNNVENGISISDLQGNVARIGTILWDDETSEWVWFLSGGGSQDQGCMPIEVNGQPGEVPEASYTTKGIMKVEEGTGLSVVDGQLKIDIDTFQRGNAAQFGIMRMGEHLVLIDGKLTVAEAGTSTDGIMSQSMYNKLNSIQAEATKNSAGNGVSIIGGVISAKCDETTITSATGVIAAISS